MTKLTTATDRTEVSAAGSTVTASVRIQPGMADEDVTRHIALCLDTSGSMAGEKIEQVCEGVRWVFGYLADDDYLSIVSFDDEVEVLLEGTRWGDVTLDDAEALVDELSPGGGTDILAGLEAAYGTLSNLPAGPDVGRRILLLSDGRDETPVDSFADFARHVRREDGIAVPAAGIGDDYDEDVIRTVGTASDGEWVHLSRPTDIENFFGRKVESLRTVVAPNPNLELLLPRGAVFRDAFLRHPQVRDANYEVTDNLVRVFLPDLLEFELQEVVMSIDSPPCEVGRRYTLADVTLHTREDSTQELVEVDCVPADAGDVAGVDSAEVATNAVETRIRKAAAEGDVDRAATILKEATGVELEGFEDVSTRVRGGGEAAGHAVEVDDDTAIRGQDPGSPGPADAGDEETQIRGQGPGSPGAADVADAGDEETQIRGKGAGSPGVADAGDEETQIRGKGAGSPGAADAGDEETQIRGKGPGSPDEADAADAGAEETQIRGKGPGSPDAADAGTEETQIRGDSPGSPGAADAGDEETQIRRSGVQDVSDVVDDETVDAWQTMIERAATGDREAKYETTKIEGPDER